MTKIETDILKKALFIIGREEVLAYKALPDEKFIFSKEFEKKAYAINKRRKSLFYRATKTVPRKIAVILIAAVITFTMMMSVSAIRIPVLNFLANIYDTYISIYFMEDKEDLNIPTSIEHMYLPTSIPEGYIQIDSQNYGASTETIWMNDIFLIILNQDILEDEFKAFIDNENVEYQILSVDDNIIHYYLKDRYYFTIWTDGSYLFTMTCPDNIPLSEIEKIIGSME